MRLVLGLLFVLGASGVFAQKIVLLDSDSVPVKKVMVSNITMDESVFSNKEGEVDLTMFQEDDELIQIQHQSYETIILPKEELVKLKTILLTTATNRVGVVEVIVNAKTNETKYEVITQTASISREHIQQQSPATTADMLDNTGQVQIQKSQLGGGSPILRGFEANRVLLVVDGVRMNNAIYRSGHLQNAISVDPNLLEGTDVVFGPNSLVYGSDALGGVIHFKTRDPKFKIDSNSVEKIDGAFRYQSALDARSANINYQNGTNKFAYLLGVTQINFGDLTMGKNRYHDFQDFGKIENYVTQFEGVDSMVTNKTPNTVKNSGYDQTDLLWKGLYKANKHTNLKLNFQYSTTSNVPRVDKLNEYKNGVLRYGEWHYGPQTRSLLAISSETEKRTKWFDYNNTIFAYQFIEEDRISRNFQSEIQENNNEEVAVYSFNSDFIKHLDSTRTTKLNYGIEGLYNQVSSTAFSKNINTGQTLNDIATRYPGKGADYSSIAAYIAVQKKIKNHIFKAGGRYTLTNMLARFDTNEIINLVNIQQKELTTQALTSSAGYVYRKGNFKFYSSISSAFKTPNVDDFGKIFEKKGDLTIPNPNLKPETSINYELGSNLMHEVIDFDVAGFYTQVFDLMTKLPTTLGGDSSLTLNGEELTLVSVQNSGIANIYGVFGAFRLKFSPRLNWHTTATITKAHFKESDEPVGHIPPLYGKSTLTYKLRKVKFSCYTRFNARKKWSDFSDLNDNPDESVESFGSLAWATLNASVFTYLNPKLKIQIAAENILDAHYKTFASGISAPGRNYIGSVYFKF